MNCIDADKFEARREVTLSHTDLLSPGRLFQFISTRLSASDISVK